jgi:shikimate dehydrogenase
MGNMVKLYGLIGYPLSHSFSKKYFTQKFELENIEGCHYELFEIDHISKLFTEVLARYPELCGFNVTIPYKKAIIPFLHDTSHLPLDACNCVSIRQGRLIGYNTDVLGFEASLKPLLADTHRPALVLGTGGAAEGVKYVLHKLGIPYTTVSRSPGKGQLIYAQLTHEVVAAHKLIINTTPLGTAPAVHECPPMAYEGIGPGHYLYDLVYNPAETRFLQLGKAQGAVVKNGAEMLELQAEASWAIWNDL